MACPRWPILAFGIASLVVQASANFGFTNPSFDYVTPSSPINLAWNGESGLVTLRLLVYPPDQVQSYLPVAANLTGSSYTWMPPSLAAGSKWTLEGIDESGQIASSPGAFTAQGDGSNPASGSNSASTTSFLQQNPQTTFITSSTSSTAQATTSTSSPTSTGSTVPSPTGAAASTPKHNNVAIWLGAVFGAALLISLVAFFIIRRRWNQGKGLPFRSSKPSPKASPMISELESKVRLSRHYMELEGSDIAGSVETSMGKRVELG